MSLVKFFQKEVRVVRVWMDCNKKRLARCKQGFLFADLIGKEGRKKLREFRRERNMSGEAK